METMSEPDNLLIAEFNARRSEAAFAALVRQHVNLVFATALRQVGDAGAAEEITQNVFVALAQAAGGFGCNNKWRTDRVANGQNASATGQNRLPYSLPARRGNKIALDKNLQLARYWAAVLNWFWLEH